MPDLGRLRWVMDVDTTRFDAGMRRARAGIRAIGAMMAGLGVARAVGGAAQRAETLVQGGKATGLGVVPLQELEFAATQSGMQPGELIGQLTAFSRNMALLRKGKGPLKRIGGAASTALRQVAAAYGTGGTEAAFLALSGAVSQMEPGLGGALAERAGFGGLGAYELLAGGPAGIAGARERYRRYNRPMTQASAEALKERADQAAAVMGLGTSTFQSSVANIANLEGFGRATGGAGMSGAFGQALTLLREIATNTKTGLIGP